MRYFVVPPFCENGTKDVNAIVDKVKALTQANTPLYIALIICLCVGSVVQGLRTLDNASGVGGKGFLVPEIN